MNNRISRDLAELLEAGILNEETATKIQEYYQSKQKPSSNRLTLVFSILGATLVGLGIILIIAHNWDELSKTVKTAFAFVPLLIGQALCAYTILKKKESIGWREASGVFLFFAIGACISLISQIYHIEGDMSSFLKIWMLLSLPLIYLLPSSMVSLLYIVGISSYAAETGYGRWNQPPYLYLAFLAAVLPHYYYLWKHKRDSNFFNFHSWFIAGSVIHALGTFSDEVPELMWIAYIGLFSVLFLRGTSGAYQSKSLVANPFRLLGALGILICCLIFSFEEIWNGLFDPYPSIEALFKSPEIWISIGFIILAAFFFTKEKRISNDLKINPLTIAFLYFSITFFIGTANSVIGMILINLFLLLTGIYYINRGSETDHLGFLNMGLLILTALMVCRFFDTDMSFVVKGILFVALGAGFFIANYRLLKKRRES